MLAKYGWRSVKSAVLSQLTSFSTIRLSMSRHYSSSGRLFTQRYKQVKGGVFRLSNISGTKTGTGFMVDEDGNAFTCAHLFDWLPGGQCRDTKCMFTFEDGFKCPGIAHHFDDDLDLAICRPNSAFMPDKKIFKPLIIGTDDVEVGYEVFVLGFPEAKLSMSTGILSDISNRFFSPVTLTPDIVRVYGFDASLSKGHAGGPLCNDRGEAIGIIGNIASYQTESVLRPSSSHLPPEILIPKKLGVALPITELGKRWMVQQA